MKRIISCQFLLGLSLTFYPVHAQLDSNDTVTYDSLVDLFPALKSLEVDRPNKHPKPGQQHFPRCCLQAVREDYEGKSSTFRGKFTNLTVSQLNTTQFPCGAKFQDDHEEGAPEVRVDYRWCKSNCDGWQRSSSKALNEWVQPFVGFILPSAVFCLHVSILLS